MPLPWYGLIGTLCYYLLILTIFIITDIVIKKIIEKRRKTITLSKTAPKKKTVEPCWKGCDESLLKKFEEAE